jgi:hypothetical protein
MMEKMSLTYLSPKYVQINTSDLKSTEQLVLWSLRTWVMGLIHRRCVLGDLFHAYDYYTAGTAAIDFDRFLRNLTKGAKRNIDIRCPLSSHISPDELTFLNILHNYQSGNTHYGDIMLLEMQENTELEKTKELLFSFLKNIEKLGKIFISAHKLQNNHSQTKPYLENFPAHLTVTK